MSEFKDEWVDAVRVPPMSPDVLHAPFDEWFDLVPADETVAESRPMSRAATKPGTAKSRAMELDELRTHARRQFPLAPGRIVDSAVRTMHRMARTGRLRMEPRS